MRSNIAHCVSEKIAPIMHVCADIAAVSCEGQMYCSDMDPEERGRHIWAGSVEVLHWPPQRSLAHCTMVTLEDGNAGSSDGCSEHV